MLVETIKSRCKSVGITLPCLEQTAGIGKNTIYRWNESSPSVDKLKAVADVLHCTVDELLKEGKEIRNEEEAAACDS